jgi:hypothetical protein
MALNARAAHSDRTVLGAIFKSAATCSVVSKPFKDMAEIAGSDG